MAGLTVTLIEGPHILGDLALQIADVDFDDSYPTGGEALVASTLGLNEILFMNCESKAGYVFRWNSSTGKLMAYWVDTTVDGAPMSEVANTTSLAAVTDVRITAYGR